jgi:nitroimidazol reductase NimA-like FMN-containing flavoprotein (pyridoxamine 5'-phosphate oxidase superfamily)
VLIQELTRQASLDLLARTHLGRLACAKGNQPYVVPVYFAYANEYLYSFSTIGQKIEWMRANPLVCVEAAEVVSPEQWVSVIVFGRYEELPDTPEWQSARSFAHTLLKRNAVWWEPAYAKTILHGTQRPLSPVFYRIHGLQITGHRATPEPVTRPATRRSMTDSEDGWLQHLLRQVRSKFKA